MVQKIDFETTSIGTRIASQGQRFPLMSRGLATCPSEKKHFLKKKWIIQIEFNEISKKKKCKPMGGKLLLQSKCAATSDATWE